VIDATLAVLEAAWELAQDAELKSLSALLRMALLAKRADPAGKRVSTAEAVDRLATTLDRLPADHPLFDYTRELLNKLQREYRDKWRDVENPTDVVTRLEKLLADTPDDHPQRARVMVRFACALLQTVTQTGSVEDLERARGLLLGANHMPGLTDFDLYGIQQALGNADVLSAHLHDDPDQLHAALDSTRTSSGLLPSEHTEQELIGPMLTNMLGLRYLLTGDRESLDAARYFVRTKPAADKTVAGHPPAADPPQVGERLSHRLQAEATETIALLDIAGSLLDMVNRPDAVEVDRIAAGMEHLLASPRSLDRDDLLDYTLQVMSLIRAVFDPSAAGFLTDPAKAAQLVKRAAELETQIGATADPLNPVEAQLVGGSAALIAGIVGRDAAAFQRGISLLGQVCASPKLPGSERAGYLTLLAHSLLLRYSRFQRAPDLHNAIDRLEQAARLIRQASGFLGATWTLHLLGEAYALRADGNRGDQGRAVRIGLEALRRRAEDVLLQSGAGRGLAAARSAAGEASVVAGWCLRFGRPEAAVTALELGRGMVLHAATAEASVPAMLRDAGHPDLAGEWELLPEDRPWDDESRLPPGHLATAEMPGDLRRRGLAAIRDSVTATRLLSPPSVDDIVAALRSAGADALVYLLPGQEGRSGRALLVGADSRVEPVPLDGLNSVNLGRVSAFERAQRAVRQAADQAIFGEVMAAWRRSLAELCGWAWPAAMRQVLERLGPPGRRPRLVLVPVGALGTVPWHAASRPAGRSELRYACQDAVISYAASARQFVDAARRGHQPRAGSATLVRVGGSELPGVDWELAEIRRHYPGCTYLGEDGPVGADAVRGLLPSSHRPGVSMLHLGCHAEYADPPVESALLLDGDERLHIRDMLRQARHRPADAPGGVVVLAACITDLTDEAHDEALTLATAFLAAGAAGVVGTRWPVADLPTALFMVMFHHYLNAGYDDPSVALRAAQLWMLNPRRELPAGSDEHLAASARRSYLAAPHHWAGFTYQGR
jgi:CHAT domain